MVTAVGFEVHDSGSAGIVSVVSPETLLLRNLALP